MALKFYWRGESATFGAEDYSAGDTTPTGSNLTYGTDGAKIGTNGLIGAASVSSNASFTATDILANTADVDTAVGSAGYWWKQETTLGGNGLVHGFRIYSNNTTKAFDVMTTTGGKLSLWCRNVVVEALQITVPTAISADTWYFVVVRWDVPNDKMKLEIYTDAGGSTTALLDEIEATSGVAAVVNSTDFGASAFTLLQWNVKASSSGRAFSDNMMLSDNYDAPLQNNAFITDYANYSESVGQPTRSRARGIPGMNNIGSRFGRGW